MDIVEKFSGFASAVTIALAAFFLAPDSLFAVPAHPGFGTVRQPDGTEARVRLRGDEWCHWHEDEKGYTVICEKTSNAWVYANLDAAGEYVPTSLLAGRDDPSSVLAKGLRSPAQRQRAGRIKTAMRKEEQGRNNTATKGTLRNLVVLVQFPDLKFKYGVSDFEKLYNETGYSVSGAQGSVKDYYREVSYGQLDLESIVAGPVTVSKGYANYGENASDSQAVKDMVAEALSLLDGQGFDFSRCDADGDGEIDGIDVIHAGYGAEYGGNSRNCIWSHKWQLRSAVYYDGVRIYNYHTEAEIDGYESRPSSNKITPIGVICHETGHFLGLPDLYDTDYSSSGAGSFCIMASGSWNGNGMRPAHMSAWCKAKLGWVVPVEISGTGDYSLPRVEDGRTIYKLHGNFPSEKEYFLLENRQGYGFDASLPGSTRGMLIWHIDDAKTNNTDENHYWVDLEEASGTQHLQLSDSVTGDDSDYWRSTTKSVFSASSTPNTASYSGGALGIEISSISASGSTMTFHASTSIGSAIPLGTALDNASLTFATGGDAAWFGQTGTASDGVSAAQSGVIGDGKSSWMQTVLTGPGELSFKWKASSEENCDMLRLVVDGANAAAISGETGWLAFSTNLTLGSHTVRWTYVKDYSAKDGQDCGWVDRVVWTPASGDGDSARATLPQGGGSATSSAISLSAPTVYARREIPSWVKSVVLNCGTSSMNLSSGNSFGSTTIGMTGTATYTVTADENTGPERTWTWNIRSQTGTLVHTLVVVQQGTEGEGTVEKPDLAVEPAEGWTSGLFLSSSAESAVECSLFSVGSPVFLNSCFGNSGSDISLPFAVLHEIIGAGGKTVASWKYDHSGGMAAGAQLCWSGAAWEPLGSLPAGSYTLRCSLDPDGTIDEENEENNTAEFAFEIAGKETVTVSFSGNGGTPSYDSAEYVVGGIYGSLPTAAWSGRVFAGWYASISGGERITENSTVSAEVDTLYARWTVRPLADVAVSALSVGKTTVPYGEALRVSFEVRNTGSAAAEGVVASLSGKYGDSSVKTWKVEIGNLAAGETRLVDSVSIPSGTFTGSVSLQAGATSGSEESDMENNSSSPVTVTFLPRESGFAGYGPFGTDDNVASDAVAPTMLVNAAVTVRGKPASRNDCVAAYRTDTGELCGLGKVLGDDGLLSMVMNINAGVKIHFKLWTSSSGLEKPEILDCDAASDLATPSPGTFLTGRTLSFASSTVLEIALSTPKWHQVSFNVLPDDPSPEAVFADAAEKIGYVTSGSRYWSPDYGGNLQAIAVGAGYWVQTTGPDVELSVSGTPDPTASITLKPGWNLIGYTPVASAPVAKALASALSSGIITYVCYGSGIYPGSLATMQPGKGYWVYAVRSGSIAYDPVAGVSPEQSSGRAQPETYGPFGTENDVVGGDAVAPTIVQDAQVLIDGSPAADGDCVAAYRTDDGRLCGLARVEGDDGLFSMVLYLNAGTIVQFKVWRAASGLDSPEILGAADTFVAPAPGSQPLTGIVVNVAKGGGDTDDGGDTAIDDEPWPDDASPFSSSSARTYDGMVFEDGVLKGTVCVKTAQGVKKSGRMVAAVSATVKTPSATYTYTGGSTSTGESISNWTKKTKGAPALEVTLRGDAMRGVFGDSPVSGARRVASRFASCAGVWTTTVADIDGRTGHLVFTVNAKGAVVVSGSYPDGRKAIGTAQAVAGADSAWIPWIAKTPSGGEFRLVARIKPGANVSVREVSFGAEDGDEEWFETDACIAGLSSEDGWEIQSPWIPSGENAGATVPFVRARPPVIDKTDFAENHTNYIGVAYSETISVNSSGHPVKFSASKLPTGLSINATTGVISGSPVRAGVFVATIKATSAVDAKWTDSVRKTFVIEKLPGWATGAFNGCGTLSDGVTEGEYGDSAVFALSVTSAGKLSGKLRFKGIDCTISASRFSEFPVGDSNGKFEAVVKNGKNSYAAEIAIAAPLDEGGLAMVGGIVEIGERIVEFDGYKTIWGGSDAKAFAKKKLNKKTLTLKGEDFGLAAGEQLKLAFDAAGKVKIAGKFVTGKKNGKNVFYSVSASATVCATELYIDDDGEWSFTGDVYVYFPAKTAKKFGGYFRQVTVWCAEGMNLQAY